MNKGSGRALSPTSVGLGGYREVRVGWPRVAVCLAAFNGRAWLQEQLQSILQQEGVEVRIYVSVDCSDDGTEAWVSEYCRAEGRVLLLPTGERFGGAAPNFFRLLKEVDFSQFEYVSLADQDDIWYPDKLQRAISMLEESKADCYSSNVMAFWDDGTQRLIDKAQRQRQWDFLFEAAGPGCTYVLRRAVAEEVKKLLHDKRDLVANIGLHDWFIYAFARTRGYRWMIDARPSMAYRQHALNQVGVNSGWRAYVSRARKIFGGWGISQARLIARVIGVDNAGFCRPWRRPGRLGVLWLALNAFRSRRKGADMVLFTLACLSLCVLGDRSNDQ